MLCSLSWCSAMHWPEDVRIVSPCVVIPGNHVQQYGTLHRHTATGEMQSPVNYVQKLDVDCWRAYVAVVPAAVVIVSRKASDVSRVHNSSNTQLAIQEDRPIPSVTTLYHGAYVLEIIAC